MAKPTLLFTLEQDTGQHYRILIDDKDFDILCRHAELVGVHPQEVLKFFWDILIQDLQQYNQRYGNISLMKDMPHPSDLEKIFPQVLLALGIGIDDYPHPVICDGCGEEGRARYPRDHRIILCPDCIAKRHKGKTSDEFFADLKRDYGDKKKAN